MSILVDRSTRVLVQGLGKAGTFHAIQCRDYGTQIVGAVAPGKGGTAKEGFPLFNTVAEALRKTGANATMIFVPPPAAADAIMEAADAGIAVIVAITEGIPVLDMARVMRFLRSLTLPARQGPSLTLPARQGCRLVGPNCPGVITPGQCKIGIMPGYIHKPGPVGVISRSGTLTYEAVWQLSGLGLGQSTCVGLGGDPIVGTSFIDALELFESDPQTEAILMIGEIGGTAEEKAAEHIKKHVTKPVAAFICGQTAPSGKRMGHAGAIISGGSGTAKDKIAALRAAGITVADTPADLGAAVQQAIKQRASRPSRNERPTAAAPTRTRRVTGKKKRPAAHKKAALTGKRRSAAKKAAPTRRR